MGLQKKQLIGAHNVNDFIQDGKSISVGREMILTPGAKDILLNEGIRICYEKTEKERNCSERTVKDVASQEEQKKKVTAVIVRLLHKEYGIDNPEKLQDISLQVLEKIYNKEK